MRTWKLGLVVMSLGALAACSGDGDDMDAGADGGVTPDSSGGETDAFVPPVDAFVPEVDAFVPPVDAGPACPDVTGMYEVTSSMGSCGSYSSSTPQTIVPAMSGVACEVSFVSMAPKRIPGINGDATVGGDGGFTSDLALGSDPPDECSGVWDEAAETMTVTCSDVKGVDCDIVLHRTGPLGT